MKIAIMMRAMDQDSGFYVYVDGLVNALLNLKNDNTYLLLYKTQKWFGRFSQHKNATELLITSPNKIIWDQVITPYIAWKHKADIIFNPKFTVPLISHCPVVMGLQEHGWFKYPENYQKFNALYQKIMTPIYARKAAHFFPMVKWVIDENRKHINLPFDNATVTYPGIQEHLKPVSDQIILNEFRKKYNLPDKFILSITRVDNPGLHRSVKWNPIQNPDTTLESFLLIKNKINHHLVFAGRRIKDYFIYNGFSDKDFEKVHFINFVPFNEIQNLYTLAYLIVLPGYYESFSFTLVGAMACGCPTVVSTTGAFKEIVGDGAIYADPYSPQDFAEKILAVLNDPDLRNKLIKKNFELAAKYTWEETARETLKGIEELLGLKNSLKATGDVYVEP